MNTADCSPNPSGFISMNNKNLTQCPSEGFDFRSFS